MRTHTCNELHHSNIGETVTLIGWVNSNRDHGGVAFIDLRDREGMTQVVFRPEENAKAAELAKSLRSEDMIQVSGKVEERPEIDGNSTVNPDMATGSIEISASELVIVNKSEVLPFQLDKELSNEDLRMKYRYLDLRRARMTRNLRLRHRITQSTRNFLDADGYCEIETPILSKSTPEGARDFLVPSRMHPNHFYALPQAPQQYKQLLMCGGIEKYFQIARCFRDEDLRADRQPEFTQIDIESSFVTPDDMHGLIEGLLGKVFKDALGVEIPASFDRMTYVDAMNTYGSDKPDRRFEYHLTELSEELKDCEFRVFSGAIANGGVVKAINAKGFAGATQGQIEKLTQTAIEAGSKGLAYIQARDVDRSTWRSPFVKRMTDEEVEALREKLNIEPGDLILFGAGEWESVCEVLGRIRLECANLQNLLEGNEELNFLWVTEFPLLGFDEEENKWNAVHHPFTRPIPEDVDQLIAATKAELDDESQRYAGLRAQAYDVVLNGYELGGGSIRIHEAELQSAMFTALGVTEEEKESMFGHILEAFKFGAPPHGGIALGLDRLAMLICGESSIREVIAFPKNNRGMDIMSASPAAVDFKQLRELRIQSTVKDKPKA
ncbi:aspartate--tRNA ligase [Verrucomicrobiaceae bacterium N1E253]|uniref:Aspartate--tRNA(Asp/Asn) ligase n=1 Tax=Oceaniferula marina TaxID=2748318 RepID=A0A851GJ00_9BACT|nr:aspartate--tRNA ligase [Oceaniferula marina]NWK54630.1 aspartate--tRNA ligase [Oceaniferula marina]